ncbi:ABC transporter substrate-binding protein [Phyllobacterium sophorae]|uniref:ABC transporter substrate-binding protein n=1 Tax=Phyllobacterium sophorae TaxID=1520277 RepID=A0A2P7B6Y9_9HYPH|nr:ABC transporter substrate-binding protein [Phyllobacterium sophorae]PSH62209.1 ABC transporter substrate-binding protein [Phyllobacterium sophorae]
MGNFTLDRRTLLRGAGALGLAAPFGSMALTGLAGAQNAAAPAKELKKIKFATNASAICLAPVFVAKEQGIFAKYGLDVELVNFGASTEALLEAIATGKADGGVGMALRWLKALEQGFDVKITAGTHGGCSRLVTPASTGLKTLSDLKGKSIGVSDLASPGKNFFSILLNKEGINPVSDVEWRQYPGELLQVAAEKGEIHAIADGDPKAFFWLRDNNYVQIASNLDHGFENRVCCIVGLRGSLIRDDLPTATALTRALLEAQDWTVAKPEDAARAFLPNAPKDKSTDDLIAVLLAQTHNHNPTGTDLKKEIALYAGELRDVQVFKQSTDPDAFAEKVYANVLTA